MLHRRDRIGDRDRAPGHIGVQPLDHPPVELDRATRCVLGPLERRDDLARLRDLFRRRREDRVASLDVILNG